MTLTLTRQSPADIGEAALDGGEVTFQIPSEVKKDKLGQKDVVNTKVSGVPQAHACAYASSCLSCMSKSGLSLSC